MYEAVWLRDGNQICGFSAHALSEADFLRRAADYLDDKANLPVSAELAEAVIQVRPSLARSD